MSTQEIRAQLSITRPQGGLGPGYISIRIADEASRVQFVELEVPLAEMMNALTGLVVSDIPGEVRRLDLVGMVRQTKTVEVPCPSWPESGEGPRTNGEDAALRVYEVDGWKARLADMRNPHCRIKKDGASYQRVAFVRHVHPEEAIE